MRLVHKDGVQIMEIDKSADAGLIAMLKAQGWSVMGEKQETRYRRVIGIHPLADIVLQMKLKDMEEK